MSWRTLLFGAVRRPPEADLSTRLKERILKRTGNRVRYLDVQSVHGSVIVSGEVDTPYVWQLALAAARGGMDHPDRLSMNVQVAPH